jgi:hypothetical protein
MAWRAASQSRAAAPALDLCHRKLAEAHMPGIGSAPVGTVAMKDVHNLQALDAARRLELEITGPGRALDLIVRVLATRQDDQPTSVAPLSPRRPALGSVRPAAATVLGLTIEQPSSGMTGAWPNS